MFKKLLSMVLAAIMLMGMGTTAFASTSMNLENEHVGDTITYESQDYTVYQQNDDGTAYAFSTNAHAAYAACQHRALEPINPSPYPPLTFSYPSTKTADYCYKQRTVQDARCISCKQTGFKIFGTWKEVAHDYPLFGSVCKKCDYKK